MKPPTFRSIAGALLVPAVLASTPVVHDLLPRQSDSVGKAVRTTSGLVIGHPAAVGSGVTEYLGIPYAKPPVGNLRWQAPVNYTGTAAINGSEFGFACWQASPLLAAAYNGNYSSALPNLTALYDAGAFLPIYPDVDLPQSEDCLTLNVWSRPQVGTVKKAVLVWIHGGSFTTGSSVAEAWYNGEFLAAEQNIVVVSFNYRLNIFGFPGNPTTAPNLGILDQRMAIEWVRDNIAAFGGDPDRIALFGQSAGAASIDLHSFAYADDPIAAGFILQSGTSTSFGNQRPEDAAHLWMLAAKGVRCDSQGSDPDKVYNCMTTRSASELANNLPPVGLSPNGLPFGPVVDNKIIFSDYHNRKPAALPMVIGNTDDESALFQWMIPPNVFVPPGYWDILNDQAFTCPVSRRAETSVRQNNPTWRYRWFGAFPNLLLNWIPGPPDGAWHGSELPSIFNATPLSILPNTHGQNTIGEYLRGAWAAFAKDPVNGLVAYDKWPNYDRKGQTLIRLAFNDSTGSNLSAGNKYDFPCRLGGPGGPGQPNIASRIIDILAKEGTPATQVRRSTNGAGGIVVHGWPAVLVVGFCVASCLL